MIAHQYSTEVSPVLHLPLWQVDPVFTSDGYTYERVAISEWLALSDISPLTSEPLEYKTLVPNKLVRSMIVEFAEAHPELAQCANVLDRLSL